MLSEPETERRNNSNTTFSVLQTQSRLYQQLQPDVHFYMQHTYML